LVPVFKWYSFVLVGFIAIKWSKPEQKSIGHSISGLVFKWHLDFFPVSNGYNKMAAKNGPVLGWMVRTKINHLKNRLVHISSVYCKRLVKY
jgi:glucose uptake protein GlcU